MKWRKRAWWIWFREIAGPICVVGAVMLITAITIASGGMTLATGTSAAAVQDFAQTAAFDDDAGFAITDAAIAADTAAQVARQEDFQPGADQSVPIVQVAVTNEAAGKEADIATTTIERIRYAALKPAHFQPFALTAS